MQELKFIPKIPYDSLYRVLEPPTIHELLTRGHNGFAGLGNNQVLLYGKGKKIEAWTKIIIHETFHKILSDVLESKYHHEAMKLMEVDYV